jgi:hypothetical protein
LKKVLALNKPEWHFILAGCIASIITGASQPAISIIFSKVISVSNTVFRFLFQKHF